MAQNGTHHHLTPIEAEPHYYLRCACWSITIMCMAYCYGEVHTLLMDIWPHSHALFCLFTTIPTHSISWGYIVTNKAKIHDPSSPYGSFHEKSNCNGSNHRPISLALIWKKPHVWSMEECNSASFVRAKVTGQMIESFFIS